MITITTTIVVLSLTNCGFLVFTTDIVELDSILEQDALLLQPHYTGQFSAGAGMALSVYNYNYIIMFVVT